MKKIKLSILSMALIILFTGCSSKPSDDEIKKALDEGTISIEDAMEKEWIDEEWIDKNLDTVAASDKTIENAMGNFSSINQNGDEYIYNGENDLTFMIFFNPDNPEYIDEMDKLSNVYAEVTDKGGDILAISVSEDDLSNELDYPFTIIKYNDELKSALGDQVSMIIDILEERPITAVWNTDGAFISAWQAGFDEEDILESVTSFSSDNETGENN